MQDFLFSQGIVGHLLFLPEVTLREFQGGGEKKIIVMFEAALEARRRVSLDPLADSVVGDILVR